MGKLYDPHFYLQFFCQKFSLEYFYRYFFEKWFTALAKVDAACCRYPLVDRSVFAGMRI